MSHGNSDEVDPSSLDLSKREDLIKLFPTFLQEQLALEAKSNGKSSKNRNTVDIELFTLQTPYKDKTLLENTSLFLEPCKRHCLYGGNGTGKTLLFERMADCGIKGFPKHLHVHHLKELDHIENAKNVIDTVVESNIVRNSLLVCRKMLAEAAEKATPEQKEGIQNNKEYIDMMWRSCEGDTAVQRASKMLRVLGFDESGLKRSTNDLSGGLRMRVALACAFFANADLLLLDEPTNHLDFPSVLWLENRLRGYSKSFLLVTHDRDLLNNVTTSVMLLEDKKIKFFPMGFSQFEKHKAKLDEKKMKDAEQFLKLNRNCDNSTAQGRRVYDLRNWLSDYREKQVRMAGKFTFPAATPLENKGNLAPAEISIINLQNVRFSYNPDEEDPNFIFDTPINFNVTAATRCGIMGPNGAGKSTLLKLLTKKIVPTEGTVTWHPNFTLAYFGQHSTKELKLELTPMEFMMEQFPDVKKTGLLRAHLAKTGVSGGNESTRMQNLSYSMRSCVIFAKLTYVCPHLLIMDEPTNFLDIASVDSLISAANKFPGALLVVTHSRHFLRKCANQYLSVVPGSFKMFNKMKAAEEATYTFIQEMEAGGKVGASALVDTPGGGSRHPTAKEMEAKNAVAAASGKPPIYKFAVGEHVEAIWTDKKYYPATIRDIRTGPVVKYGCFYPGFNKIAAIPQNGIKKVTAEKAAAALAAAAEKAEIKRKAIEREAEAKKARDAAKNKKWEVGEKCCAMYSDKKWYAAKIEKVLPFDQYMVIYTDFPADPAVKLPKKQVKPFDSSLLAQGRNNKKGGAKGKGKGNGKGKSQGQRQGQGQGARKGRQGQRAPRQRKLSAQAA